MNVLDLRQDFPDVDALIARAVRAFLASGSPAELVSRFDIIFSLGDTESIPWIFVNIDTKPGAKPDGSPTHPNVASLMRPDWLPFVNAVADDMKVRVVLPNGTIQSCEGDELLGTIGDFLVETLLGARARGVFFELQKRDEAELGVADPTTGCFGWPLYKDRGKENKLY